MNKVVIKGELPSLNEYIKAERANRYAAANLKKRYTALCSVYARASRNSGVEFSWPCKLKFTWYTKNNRKDADNIAFAKNGLASLNLRGTRRTTEKMRTISRLLKSLCWTAL
ncbi:hypothetical protein MRS59_00900 [Lactiplantibacillus plantarum]|nr:hypothetical protein [Lactiplantibacillus plantarum]MDI5784226.1 hypothetical protein [Lactiplantibacillus plantarum]